MTKGDRAGIRAAQADITSVLQGQFIEGKFTFEGGAPTGSASDAVQKYKDSISDEPLKELIYKAGRECQDYRLYRKGTRFR